MGDNFGLTDRLRAFYLIATFRPKLTAAIILFGVLTAVLEGIGVTFVIPLVEIAQSPDEQPDEGLVAIFAAIYAVFNIPFTLGLIVGGLSVVLALRYVATFLTAWARVYLTTKYVRDLQHRAFEHALDARVAYFDTEGSDDILNAIVTQAEKAGQAIKAFVMIFQSGLLILMYVAIALYLAPFLTFVAIVFVAILTYGLRNTIESAYTIGDRVADANERIQRTVQAGTQGIREVKTIGYEKSLLDEFSSGMKQYVTSTIKVERNEALIGNAYNLSIAILIFALIYVAFVFTDLSFGELATFLFVIFKLGPAVSTANKRYYQLEGLLPHLVRTEDFIEDLIHNAELEGGDRPVPSEPTPLEFDHVSFSYNSEDAVLNDISFTADRGEFVAFVGESGAGKSTIASLIARLYEPTSGQISAGGIPIEEFSIEEWRSRVAYVRQSPFIFNTTLEENLLMANPQATRQEMEEVIEIAQVTEFLDELPDGIKTRLGDNGVRLSGGQRQRVALARALLQDADFLILDEATSDLDTNIESRVQAGLDSMTKEFTTIAIAHRLSTVKGADQIYTLADGKIVEGGRHESLIKNEGRYAELYHAQ